MGKKSKNSLKTTTKGNKAHLVDASSLKIPGISYLDIFIFIVLTLYFLERCLEEFEKSLATMV